MTKPAPLVGTDTAPVPANGAAEWFSGAGGLALRAALFLPEGEAKGSAIVSPGRSEPLEKYFEVVRELQGRGLVVLIHDWRGQGLSTRLLPVRLKGHADGFDDFVTDYRKLLDTFEARLPKPWIAVSHSMGGVLTLAALAAGEKRLSAAILSAPMFAVNTGERSYDTSRRLAWAASLTPLKSGFLFFATGDPSTHTFEGEGLTHDRRRYDIYAAQLKACPDLALGNLTWGWLNSAFRLTDSLRKPGALEKITIPVTVLSAELDDRVSNPEQKAMTARLPKGRWLEVPGAYHEILMETDERRAVFWQAFDALWEITEGAAAA